MFKKILIGNTKIYFVWIFEQRFTVITYASYSIIKNYGCQCYSLKKKATPLTNRESIAVDELSRFPMESVKQEFHLSGMNMCNV